MSDGNPPHASFAVYDEEQPTDTGFYNPYVNEYNDGGQNLDNNSSILLPNDQGPEKSQTSLYQTDRNPEKTNSTLIQTSQNIPDSHGADDTSHQHHRPHTHTHAHHTHHTHSRHGHQHHHTHDQSEHHHHDNTIHHHHHHHEQDNEPDNTHHHHHHEYNHQHEHVHNEFEHENEHPYHNHIHEHHPPTPLLQPIHHHQHDSGSASALTIRRHLPGAIDPTLQNFPPRYSPHQIYTSPGHNLSLPPNVRVTIRRNTPVVADHTLVQPILYPVAVFTNSSGPQAIRETPKPRTSKLPRIQPKPPTPKPPTPKPRTPLRTSPIPPVPPPKLSPVPPKPPVKSPVKPPPPPPPKSPVRPPPELTPVPPPKKNVIIRKPIRTDIVTSAVRRTAQPPPRPVTRVIVQEQSKYNQYHRRPPVNLGGKKGVSYRTVPGLTTREMENDEMDDSGAPIYVQTPRVQTVTYRT